jgi:hypothetical protein
MHHPEPSAAVQVRDPRSVGGPHGLGSTHSFGELPDVGAQRVGEIDLAGLQRCHRLGPNEGDPASVDRGRPSSRRSA